MKSRLTTIYLLIISFSSWGQLIKLETGNPAPRVGDKVSISFVIEKNNLDSMEVTDDIVDKMLVESMNRVGDGHIEISEWFLTEVGPLKIGPLQLPINEKIYRTNELNIIVSPKLPQDIDNGIWIRLVNFQGEDYIIFEQRQTGKFKQVEKGARTSYSMSTEDVKWAVLNGDKIQRKGIEIERRFVQTAIQSVDNGSALYKVTVFTYKPLPSFKGQLTIDKSFIIDGPDKGHFEVVTVKN